MYKLGVTILSIVLYGFGCFGICSLLFGLFSPMNSPAKLLITFMIFGIYEVCIRETVLMINKKLLKGIK